MRGSGMGRWLVAAVAALGVLLVPAVQAQPAAGDMAPEFRLQDQTGAWQELAEHRGSWVVLYFYPKDQTPGCTTEACSFRDNIFAFEKLGARILGVSLDDVGSHAEFAEKYSLPFPLLADIGGEVTELYGVMGGFGPVKMAKRQSFLIAPDGRIARHYAKVDPDTHSAEVLADLRQLAASRDDASG